MVGDGSVAERLHATAVRHQRRSAASGVKRLERERSRILRDLPAHPAKRREALSVAGDLSRRIDLAHEQLKRTRADGGSR